MKKCDKCLGKAEDLCFASCRFGKVPLVIRGFAVSEDCELGAIGATCLLEMYLTEV